MKQVILVLFSLSFLLSYSQRKETFDNLNNWLGDTNKFRINSNKLQLYDTLNTGSVYICTPSKIVQKATWEIKSELKFAPSNSNSINYILISDSQNPNDFNGYFLHIGETGSSDDLEFWKQNSQEKELLSSGVSSRFGLELDSFKIKVTRNEQNEWTIFSDIYDGNNYIEEYSFIDSSFVSSSYFGLDLSYTTTRFDKFSFDNLCITGEAITDTIKPKVIHTEIISDGLIQIEFSERVTDLTSQNISIDLAVDSIIRTNNTAFHIYTVGFTEGQIYQLTISNITDINNNELVPFTGNFVFNTPKLYDVLISEIHPNPGEESSLPNTEYIEIYNSTAFDINLENWIIQDLTSQFSLPPFLLKPNTYLVLIETQDSSKVSHLNNVFFLPNLPSLNNSGDEISLLSQENKLIHSFKYTLDNYGEHKNETSLFSLELSDIDSPCLTQELLITGGTPGKGFGGTKKEFHLTSQLHISEDSLLIHFNTDSVNITNIFTSLNNQPIENIGLHKNTLSIRPGIPLSKSTFHMLEIKNIELCNGTTTDTLYEFIITETPERSELVISEILFNPPANGYDYIEIYNNTDNKVFNLNTLKLQSIDVNTLEIKSEKNINSNTFLFPNTYYILTENREHIINNHTTEQQNVIETELTPFNDTEGRIQLLYLDSNAIDEVIYEDSYHSNLFSSTEKEGKSLERINLNESGLNKSNWFTSSSDNNFGSPTYENSVSVSGKVSQEFISLNSNHVSPDSDGFEDFIILHYNNLKKGSVINVSLYNSSGVKENDIILNELVNSSGEILLDFSISGFNPTIGIHILFIEVRQQDGSLLVFKKAVTINKQF